MNFLLFMLWWCFWFLTGYFVVLGIRIRKKRRKMIESEFYNYLVLTRKEEHERTTQKGIDEMGDVLW